MSELRPEDLTVDHFNHLTPTQAELLALLSEECGEVVQIVGKILRHGLSSCHPDGGFPNYRLLEGEIGDFIAAIRLIASAGMIDMVRVEDAADVKSRKVFKYLHHSSPPASEEKVTCPNCERKGDHYDQRGHYTCEPAEPAPPSEMPPQDEVKAVAHNVRECGSDEAAALILALSLVKWRSQPAPAPPSEMPEAVRRAVGVLRETTRNTIWREDFNSSRDRRESNEAADALESWWRSQPAPAVAMSDEEIGELASEAAINRGFHGHCALDFEEGYCAAVRAQASQPLKLEKVREALVYLKKTIAAANDGWAGAWASLRSSTTHDQIDAAIAELDAVEKGKP